MRWSKGAQAEGTRSRPHGVLRAREARRPASSRAAVAPSLHRATMLRDLDPQHRTLDRALAGRYVLERRLGRGGMGVVFLARELLLERQVAIKLLPPLKAADPRARRRFLGEARTVARLSHPNIVPVFAVDESPDAVFFVMAYVEGQTLGQRIRDQGMLTPEEGARLLREVARALAHAHERGVVHRDVKPDNILLDAATGRALVFDFGIARVGGDGGSTGSGGGVGGTADYMSREQASGLGVDARGDLYSLGVVATTRCRAGCRSTPPTAMRCWRGTSRSPRRRSRRSHRMCRAVWRRWWIAVSTKSRRPASRAASISPKRSASRLRRLRGHPSPCGPSWWRAAISHRSRSRTARSWGLRSRSSPSSSSPPRTWAPESRRRA